MSLLSLISKKKTVCISAGHSLTDPGAVKDGLRESDLNMDIVSKTADILRLHGVDTLTVPDNLSLVATINWINERSSQIDLAIECHVNSGGGTGVEAWYYHGSGDSQEFAQYIVDALMAETGMNNRGVKDESTNRYGKLGFVHDTNPLACLVETGFIDHDEDRKLLSSDEGKMKIAKGIARGILGYLGLEWKPDLLISQIPLDKQIEELNKVIKRLERSAITAESDFNNKLANKDKECQAKIKETLSTIIKFIEEIK